MSNYIWPCLFCIRQHDSSETYTRETLYCDDVVATSSRRRRDVVATFGVSMVSGIGVETNWTQPYGRLYFVPYHHPLKKSILQCHGQVGPSRTSAHEVVTCLKHNTASRHKRVLFNSASRHHWRPQSNNPPLRPSSCQERKKKFFVGRVGGLYFHFQDQPPPLKKTLILQCHGQLKPNKSSANEG